MITKNKITKLISGILIVAILLPTFLFSTSKKAEAQVIVNDPPNTFWNALTQVFSGSTAGSTVIQTCQILKDAMIEIGKELLKVAAKALLAKMTQATINWINSDFHGSPLFIENPESFFKDIAKSEVRRLVDMIGYDTFRFPFGPQTALNVIASYKSQLAENAQYTLSKVINDPDLLVRYRNDFNYGGWNGFLINTQYPQNNYLGFNMIIQQNLASRLEGTLQAPAQKVQNALQQGMGFLSPQMCADNGGKNSYNNGYNEFVRPSFKEIPWDVNKYPGASGSLQWERENNAARAEFNKKNTCKNLVNTTPGSVAANQIFNALDTPRESTTLAGALGNSVVDSVAAIFDALLNHFLDKGLSALSSTIRPTSSTQDNWSYNGQTLSGGTTTSSTATTLDIPQNVSVGVGQGTSTAISGGTAPFNIIQSQASKGVATATISTSGSSGPRITVLGVAAGTTSITVYDSTTPPKTATVNISVNDPRVLAATPPSISANINTPTIIRISGGEGNYTVKTGPNEAVALAVLSDTNLIVTGVMPGVTSVTLQDSSIPFKQVVIPITIIDPSVLTISQQDVLVYTGRTANITISGGRMPYTVAGTLPVGIIDAIILGNVLTVTGRNAGETSVTFLDSSPSPRTTNVHVTVVNPLIVSPQNISLTIPNYLNYQTNIATASISGGTAPYNVIQTSNSISIATVEIYGSRLTATAHSRGSVSVLVKDSSTAHPQTFIVNITVY